MKRIAILLTLFVLGGALSAQAQRTEYKIGNTTYYETQGKDGHTYTGSKTEIGGMTWYEGSSTNGSSYSGTGYDYGFAEETTINWSNGSSSTIYDTDGYTTYSGYDANTGDYSNETVYDWEYDY